MSAEKGKAEISAVCPNPDCKKPIKADVFFHPESGENDGCVCQHCKSQYHVLLHDPKDGKLGLYLIPKMSVTPGQAATA